DDRSWAPRQPIRHTPQPRRRASDLAGNLARADSLAPAVYDLPADQRSPVELTCELVFGVGVDPIHHRLQTFPLAVLGADVGGGAASRFDYMACGSLGHLEQHFSAVIRQLPQPAQDLGHRLRRQQSRLTPHPLLLDGIDVTRLEAMPAQESGIVRNGPGG